MVNVEAFYRTMAVVTDDNLEMGNWGEIAPDCGTTACLAGHAALVHGRAKYVRTDFDGPDQHTLVTTDENGTPNYKFDSTVAAQILGLDRDQSDIFVCGALDVDELWEEIETVTKGEVTRASFEQWRTTNAQ